MAMCVLCGDRANTVSHRGALCSACAAELLTGDVHKGVCDVIAASAVLPAHARMVMTEDGIKHLDPAFPGERAITHRRPLAARL